MRKIHECKPWMSDSIFSKTASLHLITHLWNIHCMQVTKPCWKTKLLVGMNGNCLAPVYLNTSTDGHRHFLTLVYLNAVTNKIGKYKMRKIHECKPWMSDSIFSKTASLHLITHLWNIHSMQVTKPCWKTKLLVGMNENCLAPVYLNTSRNGHQHASSTLL